MNLLITPKEQILADLQNIDSFLNITMLKKPYSVAMTWLYMLLSPANCLQTRYTGLMRQ